MSDWSLAWTWVFQWREWFKMRDYNWVNFYPIRIGIEAGSYKGRYVEVECVVLGLGFYAEAYDHPSRRAWSEEMDERVLEAESTGHFFTLEECPECDGLGTTFVEHGEDEETP